MSLPKKAFPFLLFFIRQQWVSFSFIVVASILWGANGALFPFFLKKIVDAFASHSVFSLGFQAASKTILLFVLLWLCSEIALRIQGFVFVRFLAHLRASTRRALFEYVQQHSSSYFIRHFSGAIANKIADVPANCELILSSCCFEVLVAVISAVVVMITMWMRHPLFAEVLLGWIVIHLVVTCFFVKKSRELLHHHAEAVTTLSAKIVDVITNIQNVKLFARESYERSYLDAFQQDETYKSNKAQDMLQYMYLGFSINMLGMILGMLFLLIQGWKEQWVTLGDFTQIMIQAFWLAGWMWFVSHQMTMLTKTMATINASLALIRQPHDIVDAPGASSLVVCKGKICFDHVSFSYHEQPVFKNLNITIEAGQKVGLVGLSGAGKTTFMNLILRLHELNEGNIFIDDQSIETVTQESLHQNIAVIPQEPLLFHRSLLENIRYGRLEATEEEVIEIAHQAHCHEFIQELPEKYETLVGERGVRLSGGERQRIAIARAFLKNAPILILDEATSALDSMTEKKIQEGLQQLMQGRTTLVIAHRLSTLMVMDRILVFHEGNIVEDGTMQELIKKGGHFSLLSSIQYGGRKTQESQY